MLHLVREIERRELVETYRQLHADGLASERTLLRLAVATIALSGKRPETLRHYEALGCLPLSLGAALWEPFRRADPAATHDLCREALDALQAAVKAEDEAASARRHEEQGALLPLDFSIAGITLDQFAHLRAARPDDVRIEAARAVFAGAIEAHRAGQLGEWMDAHPDARAVWPGRR